MNPGPMTFTAQNIPLVMDGTKTNSRRIMRVQPVGLPEGAYIDPYNHDYTKFTAWTKDNKMCNDQRGNVKNTCHWKPPHQPGDIVYAAEGYEAVDYNSIITRTFWFYYSEDQMKSLRKVTLTDAEWEKFINRKGDPFKNLGGRFMYKFLARSWYEILDVRAELLLDVSEEDAKAEGCTDELTGDYGEYMDSLFPYRTNFFRLWLSIHGNLDNKWVWAYTFKRVEKPED